MEKYLSYLKKSREEQLEELKELLRIPSISALSEHRQDVRAAAEWLKEALKKAGLEHVELLETAGNPVIYGDWLHAEGKPTVLVYGHYDVQPVDPLELWETPPFEPSIREGRLYARGSSDDKAQVFMHIKAVEALLKSTGSLPVNIKFCIEGEEEVGSRNLPSLLEHEQERLACDLLLISDTSMLEKGKPAICYGLRGLAGLEVIVKGAKGDLHSGLYGGAVANPIQALSKILASLHDDEGRVAVEGFYDRVEALEEEERVSMASIPFSQEKLEQELGVPSLFGEAGYSPVERMWARPTLEINGISGGFQGEGTKTVIPAKASAKITCRLVSNQDPAEIQQLIAQHVRKYTPKGVFVEVMLTDQGHPFVTPLHHPALQAAAKAYETAYGATAAFTRMGGSIPIVEAFGRILQAPVVLMGFSLPEENFHAPNEFFTLDNYDKGLVTIGYYLQEVAKLAF
ncbi:dipeptidase [Rubeoparvulum massiliense]|uniref:dipeptidase n=1 Tax=Rubeoparvulum massiliense TaxID=1631346 RepID=UPI00065E2C43|nr:dipeptidase [Rubeoparvulum massiliense]